MNPQFLNILLCDDHYISLVGIDTILTKAFNGNMKVRYSESGEEALELFEKEKPDLMILDLGLPRMSGLDVIKAIRAQSSECKLIVLSGSEDPQLLQQVTAQKVNAILRKSNSIHHLLEAFEAIYQSSETTYLDPAITRFLKDSSTLTLSPREYEIVELMSQGLTAQEIADHLGCSIATIKTHRMRIMNKSGARNASEILAWFLTKRKANRDSSP